MTKEEKKIFGWRQAVRHAIERMKPTGFIEMPGNKFLVMFDRELSGQDAYMASTLKLKLESSGFAYTYNSNSNFKKMFFAFDANVISIYENMIVYDARVEEGILSGMTDLQFKFKTQIDIYSTEYKGD